MSAGEPDPDRSYANPEVRDAFLRALDADDRALSIALAGGLLGCGNPLPGLTREAFGLPVGATYGAAARCVLASHAPADGGPPSARPIAGE